MQANVNVVPGGLAPEGAHPLPVVERVRRPGDEADAPRPLLVEMVESLGRSLFIVQQQGEDVFGVQGAVQGDDRKTLGGKLEQRLALCLRVKDDGPVYLPLG